MMNSYTKSVGKSHFLRSILTFLFIQFLSISALSQDSLKTQGDSTIINTLEAGDEADVVEPRKKIIPTEFSRKLFSIRVGAGFLYDWATYFQDENSKKQINLDPNSKLRDFRFLFKGRIGRADSKHPVTYTSGIMYDAPSKTWLFRETGLMFGIPEIAGHIFIGRTKEGFSLNKVMVGYAGWTMERATMSDATIPILADGIKYYGFLKRSRIVWNIGAYTDAINYAQAFSSYDNQVVARVGWLPVLSEKRKSVLHIAMNLRKGNVDQDTLQLRARPEAWPAPYFVDTKKFHATSTFMYGGEIYFRKGSWLIGSEYWFQDIESPESGNPTVHGGDIVITWLPTGETREYNTQGAFFKGILPKRTILQGGIGAIEPVLRFSYIDLTEGELQGGKFWRLTPMINWHLNDNVRVELAYGYGSLDRFELTGKTHFFQARIQIQL